MKINWWAISGVLVGVVLFIGLLFVLMDLEKNKLKTQGCIEIYPLDSCELYQCRANNSNWIPDMKFNIRNYEICNIIINNNISFKESLNMLETITFDS